MTDKPEELRCVPCPKCGADMGWDNSEPEPCDVCRQQAEVARLRKALERIVETHCFSECYTDDYGHGHHGIDCPKKLAAAALEGKDD